MSASSASSARNAALSEELAALTLRRASGLAYVQRETPTALRRVHLSLRSCVAQRVASDAVRLSLRRAVLVVDDDPDVCTLVAMTLRAALPGVPVHTVHSIPEALTEWPAGRYAVVVTDLLFGPTDMVGGDGLIRALRRLDDGAMTLRAVLMSGVADHVTLLRAAAHCNATPLPKPPPVEVTIAGVVRQMLDAVCPPFWATSNGDTITAVSPELTRRLGYGPRALDGIAWRAIVHPDDVRPSEVARARSRGEGIDRHPQRWRAVDGSYVALLWSTAAHAGEAVYAVAEIVD